MAQLQCPPYARIRRLVMRVRLVRQIISKALVVAMRGLKWLHVPVA